MPVYENDDRFLQNFVTTCRVTCEWARMKKEAVLASSLPGGTEDNHGISQNSRSVFEIWTRNLSKYETRMRRLLNAVYCSTSALGVIRTHTHTHTHVSSLKTPQNTKNIIYIIQLSSYALPPLTVSCLGGRESANMRYGQMILPRQPWTAEGSNYTINETVHSRYKASKWHVMF